MINMVGSTELTRPTVSIGSPASPARSDSASSASATTKAYWSCDNTRPLMAVADPWPGVVPTAHIPRGSACR